MSQPAWLSSPQNSPGRGNQAWKAFKAFMKVHWRIALAIFCSVGAVTMPFGGEGLGDKAGGSLAYLAGAVIFWTLHKRHVANRQSGVSLPAAPEAVKVGTAIEDGWSRRLSSCRMKASVFNEVGATTKSEAVRYWLSCVSDDVERELGLADDLAALGRSIEPEFTGTGTPNNSAAREAWSRLGVFEGGLDDAVATAAQVRLHSLSPTNNLDTIRGQLDMLQERLPTLNTRQ